MYQHFVHFAVILFVDVLDLSGNSLGIGGKNIPYLTIPHVDFHNGSSSAAFEYISCLEMSCASLSN
jgi:hypothetical protein